MDQPFGKPSNAVLDLSGATKAQVAQRLTESSPAAPEDVSALCCSGTFPLPVLPFTQRQDVIQRPLAATGTAVPWRHRRRARIAGRRLLLRPALLLGLARVVLVSGRSAQLIR